MSKETPTLVEVSVESLTGGETLYIAGHLHTLQEVHPYFEDGRMVLLVIKRGGKGGPQRQMFWPKSRLIAVQADTKKEATALLKQDKKTQRSESPTPARPEVTPEASASQPQEETMAAAKVEVLVSGRVQNCVDFDIKGLETEEVAKGRGTALKVSGSPTALKKLASACSAAFDERKGLEAGDVDGRSKADRYEDRYQAGQAVKRIEEALSAEG